MFKVITKKGTSYHQVKEWSAWSMNAQFICFTHNNGRIFIIKFDDIESIESA
jgi:hypothetical protein